MAELSVLEQQAQLLADNVAGWETSVLRKIGNRVQQVGRMKSSDVVQLNNVAIVKQDMRAVTKDLAKITGMNVKQIDKMYAEELARQHWLNKPLYDYRGKNFIPFAENKGLQAIAKAYAKSTAGTMVNLSNTSALMTVDEAGKILTLQKEYVKILDKATIQVASGTTDFHTAMRSSIRALGGNGIRVEYATGVTRRMDTAVRQSVLWGAKQASVAYNEMVGAELGCDGIEIDWHANPRPSHEFMQGKQFVLGESRTINGEFFESADEALERLEDYNCYHYKMPIICGISQPRYDKKELEKLNEQNKKVFEIDGKEYTGYEATQAMRKLETAVREQKSIRDMAQASGDKALVRECNANIKAYKEKYSQISEVTGIKEDTKRMSVVKSFASKDEKASVQFNFMGKEEKYKESIKIIESLSKEYDTRLKTVLVGAEKAAGTVDMSGSTMRLSSNSANTAIHEFAHTLANSRADKYGLTDDEEFWREIKKIRSAYRKDVGNDTTRWISTYEHAQVGEAKFDEFMADAFTQAKMKEMGLELPDKYGKDFTYSQQVLDVIDKYFKKK